MSSRGGEVPHLFRVLSRLAVVAHQLSRPAAQLRRLRWPALMCEPPLKGLLAIRAPGHVRQHQLPRPDHQIDVPVGHPRCLPVVR